MSARRRDPPYRPATVRTALLANCRVEALCDDCDHVQRLDLVALSERYAMTPLIELPLRCQCGSKQSQISVSGVVYRPPGMAAS